MRRAVLFIVLVIGLTSACAPAAATEAAATEAPSEVSEGPTPTSEAEASPSETLPVGPVEEAVIRQLAANLGLDETDISVVSSEEVEFSDACLGVAMEGVLCAQVVTPGRLIVLEADGIQYEYHTSEDGSHVQPATLGLVWKREGGIAGFCDILTVFRSGEVFASKCDSQAEGRMGSLATLLSPQEWQQFNEWMNNFGEVELDASDPAGVADRMVITLKIIGTGNKSPTEAEQQELFQFAQELYQKPAK